MWTFVQSTGNLLDPLSNFIERGYSGNGVFKDDPASQCVKDHGPLPRGLYTIENVVLDGGHLGPFVMPLTPDVANDMCGRGSFFIHGDNIHAPGTASDGCIIMSHVTRVAIEASLDKQLSVVDAVES